MSTRQSFSYAMVLGIIFGTIANGSAATYYVAKGGQTPQSPYTSWGTAADNIKDAVSKATVAGDTVLVSNGTYTLTAEIAVSKGITIRSFNNGAIDRDGTIINGNYPASTNRCFFLTHANALVEGFTITNGFIIGAGGGVYMTAGTLRDCLVTGNVSTNAGWAGGGGVYAKWANSVITNCDIIANLATFNADGYGESSGGGGVRLDNGAQIWNSRIMYNACPVYYTAGGGVYLRDGGKVCNSLIVSNTALDGYAGGGVWVYGVSNILRNCLIMGNGKGRILCGAGVASLTGNARIENCTVVANDGKGIGHNRTANYELINTICYSNAAENLYRYKSAGTIVATNCLVGSESMSVITSGEGNITDNPVFVDFARGDYRLRGRSPGVNTGMNLPWMAGALDLDGRPRIQEDIVDRGAYEWAPRGTVLLVR